MIEKTPPRYFAKEQLRGKDLDLYNDIEAALRSGKNSFSYRGFDANHAFSVFNYVLNDHPDYYWASGGVSYQGLLGRGEMRLASKATRSKGDDELVLEATRSFLEDLPEAANEYTVAKKVFGEIASRTSYDWDDARLSKNVNLESHSMIGVFKNKRAVCEGYARAMQYLLQKAGIEAYKLEGTAKSAAMSGPHAWVLAKINGSYYHIDPTWGDLNSSMGNEQPESPLDVNFDYLCLTDKEIGASHTAETELLLPSCSSSVDSYYRREGYYLQIWSERELADIFARQINSGCTWVAARGATEKVFAKMEEACHNGDVVCRLFSQAYKQLGGLSTSSSEYAYFTDANRRTIHVKLI